MRVEWQGHKIGYVPRRENADVARLLDRGQVLTARIVRLADPCGHGWCLLQFVNRGYDEIAT